MSNEENKNDRVTYVHKGDLVSYDDRGFSSRSFACRYAIVLHDAKEDEESLSDEGKQISGFHAYEITQGRKIHLSFCDNLFMVSKIKTKSESK